MAIINRVADFHDEMTQWRHQLHRHPEICYEELWTSDFIAGKLAEFGIDVVRGLASTGVVGILKGKTDGGRSICRKQITLSINQKQMVGCTPVAMMGI
jgi:hippurate hydrolase